MSLAISDETILQLVQNLESFSAPNQGTIAWGILGFSIGMNVSLDMTEDLRKELGLGGELFGLLFLTPIITLTSTGVGISIGAGTQEGIAKVTRAVSRLF